ncbi:MAG: site-specific DNA-methyltransferase [Rhodobacteraceae bacterium]|nr:site-specific DNA-methyltransferase [Paracoccaceae bacterium]
MGRNAIEPSIVLKQNRSIRPFWKSRDNSCWLINRRAIGFMEKLEDESVDCIWTDPPYNLSNDGVTCVAGRMVSVNKGAWDQSRGLSSDHEFNLRWINQGFRILKKTGTIWVSGTQHVHPSIGMALVQAGFRLLNDIVWVKTNPPPNLGCRTFTHASELIFWASKAGRGDRPGHKFNYQIMKAENGGKQMRSVWQMQGPSAREKAFGKHPTQKPVALIERCLRASTDEGDLILDPFAGSATTGVAAFKLNRSFIGIDNHLDYLKLARSRLRELDLPPPARDFIKFCAARLFPPVAGFGGGLNGFVFSLVQAAGAHWRGSAYTRWRTRGHSSLQHYRENQQGVGGPYGGAPSRSASEFLPKPQSRQLGTQSGAAQTRQRWSVDGQGNNGNHYD